jgi:peptidoglycan LD-endopeptidase CwlK
MARFSSHNTGLAFDVAIIKDGKLLFDGVDFDILGTLGEELGLVWGGRNKLLRDRPHFQTLGAADALRHWSQGKPE